ncbi:ABC transporter permease [Nocardiopsis coralliicola]
MAVTSAPPGPGRGAVRAQRHRPRRSAPARAAIWLLALPAITVLTVFFVVPALRLLWLSVTAPEPGLANYAAITGEGVALSVIQRTLVMALVVTAVCVLVAYPYAHLMTVATPRWRAVLLVVVLVPFWTSLMARTFAWVVLLQDGGAVQRTLAAAGLGEVRLLGTGAGVTLAMAQVMLPFVVLPLYTAMRSIDRRLVDAALSLGASPLQAFLRVYLPLSFPGVAAGATLVLVLSLGFYVTPSLVGSPQQSMLAQFISVQVNQIVDFGAAGALAVTLLIVTLLLLGAVRMATRTRGQSTGTVGASMAGGAQ